MIFILRSSFFILHSSFFILHSLFFILHSSFFFILHSSFFVFVLVFVVFVMSSSSFSSSSPTTFPSSSSFSSSSSSALAEPREFERPFRAPQRSRAGSSGHLERPSGAGRTRSRKRRQVRCFPPKPSRVKSWSEQSAQGPLRKF